MPYAAYPLGGIGTGTISLNASGELTDFQIFNRPSLGMKVPYTFFSLYVNGPFGSRALALEAKPVADFYKGRGWHPSWTRGLRRFSSSQMTVRVPFATIDFSQDDLPVRVSLTAWNPFIPGNDLDSELPGALFDIVLTNISDSPVDVMTALSMGNIHNFRGADSFDNPKQSKQCTNVTRKEDGLTGVFMTGHELAENDLLFANNAILTDDENGLTCSRWHLGAWYDGITDFWEKFQRGELANEDGSDLSDFSAVGPTAAYVGTTAIKKTIYPGETRHMRFALTWYVPNRTRGWWVNKDRETMKNHYATRFTDAWQVGKELMTRWDDLEKASRTFSDAIYTTTLPECVIDAITANISVLRSTTCWRMPDGTFMGWEGSHEQEGSCHGTCMHVWNYAQTVAFLFPRLEQSVRENEFLVEMDENGFLPFRCFKKVGLPDPKFYPAVDGTFGTIMRAWREWKLGGDREYLEKVYPRVLTAFDYGMSIWDEDGDGVPEARQHNTYDIEFFGPNPLSALIELGAIKAVEKMADEMGDKDRQEQMTSLYCKAQVRFDELCWQGEYYIQRLEDVDKYPYQFGEGCLSDQLLGQTLAFIAGLGELVPHENLVSAAKAIVKYNFATPDRRRPCLQRQFIADDETGLLLASWPNGHKPRFPFVYSDEVWTGIEYQVATLLCYLGLDEDALRIVEAVRSRFDGVRRSPWSEMECGFYYARAMASWGLLIALTGFDCHVSKGKMAFVPYNEGRFFWSHGEGWGMFTYGKTECALKLCYGRLTLQSLDFPGAEEAVSVCLNGKSIPFYVIDNGLAFSATLVPGDELSIQIPVK
ncbi:MAG: hypothetical protein IJJ23_07875 [Clostridia bacterium]|nr:hypothetical protein [Clostridia bacterium]